VDALGDTLLIACARRGDACADVLAEIARVEHDQPPLFRVNHVNADGKQNTLTFWNLTYLAC
jgi:hypothetical protein